MIDDGRIDDALADGGGDQQAEKQEGDEIEKRRPQHCPLRPHHARRHDGGDGIGGVMEAVQKIEHQRERDQKQKDVETHRLRPR